MPNYFVIDTDKFKGENYKIKSIDLFPEMQQLLKLVWLSIGLALVFDLVVN